VWAIDCRPCYPGVYEPIAAWHARANGHRFYYNNWGVVANTSRMPKWVSLVLLIIIGLRFGRDCCEGLPGAQKSVAIAGALAFILALIALAQATHLEQPLNRWQSVSEQIPADARWQASRVALGALPGAGFFGFGPGTFRVVFPGLQYRNPATPFREAGDFTRGLPADSPGMGMAGKQPLGIALLRRYSSRNS
jgi:hypothetical protein